MAQPLPEIVDTPPGLEELGCAVVAQVVEWRGPKKAIIAVVGSILTAIYHMLKDGTMYQDLGCDHFKRRSTDRQKKRLLKGLADLGYAAELKPLAA